MTVSRLKWAAILSFVVGMAILLIGGFFAGQRVPPYPGTVVGPSGDRVTTKDDILAGQEVYQKYGLMDHGSVWGHGSQRGMEFSAVTLHEMGQVARNSISRREYSRPYNELSNLDRNLVDVKVADALRRNGYDDGSDTLHLSADQVEGFEKITALWETVFSDGDKRYGFLPNTVPTAEERRHIGAFFFWTAWAAVTDRPGESYSYTNNWPPDASVGNVATVETYVYSIAGVFSLFLSLGLFIYWVHRHKLWYGAAKGVRLAELLIDAPLTSSQRKAAKFFLVVVLLLLLQTLFGGLLAHYTVDPGTFYIKQVAELIPYSWAKTWHLQLAIFWIATTWVASAIYIVPVAGGREPKGQGVLVQLLFVAVLIVALGSLAGEAVSVKGLAGEMWYWLGHQGWEYLELGRIWQILLFVGLIFWLLIISRPIKRYLGRARKNNHFNSLVVFYALSAIMVVGFFGFGLFYGKGTHLSVADYWRWFVVHIWVESIFEFFGVAAISLLLVAMGLAKAKEALIVAYFTAALMFISGIVGTAHHYFWYGGPSFWLALGSVFSSIEPVPLFGLVVRGLMEYRALQKEGREFPFRWPMYFLVASSFWNFLGAGVYGFLINLPIVNYYEHGTYLTMNHGHTALFGTYGMLSIALLLFSWRGLVKKDHWNDRLLKISFIGFNGGLMAMSLVTLLPVGLVQAWTSFDKGLWVARDASFFEQGFVRTLGQIRAIPDLVIILVGVVPLAWFLVSTFGKLKAQEIAPGESVWERLGVDLDVADEEPPPER